MNKTEGNKIRLYVVKSNKHIYANIIDDQMDKVLTSISTLSKEVKKSRKCFKNCLTAAIVGKQIALKLKRLGIKKIIFDRGKNIYHGQIEALANATREGGIVF